MKLNIEMGSVGGNNRIDFKTKLIAIIWISESMHSIDFKCTLNNILWTHITFYAFSNRTNVNIGTLNMHTHTCIYKQSFIHVKSKQKKSNLIEMENWSSHFFFVSVSFSSFFVSVANSNEFHFGSTCDLIFQFCGSFQL